MIELFHDADYNIKVTHHCQMFVMNDDPFGRLYDKLANPEDDGKVTIDIKRQEVNMTKDGIVSVVVFYDRYEKIPKEKVVKKSSIEEEL